MDKAKGRIAICITLAEQGGAQLFVSRFAKWLAGSGHEVTVYAGSGSWLKEQLAGSGATFVQVPYLSREINPFHDPLALAWLRREFRRTKPDAIHLNSAKMGILGSLAARSYKLRATSYEPRVVYRIGGWTFLEPLPPLKKNLYRLLERWTARFKDTIICVHPGDVEEARRAGMRPRRELIAVPNGIDLKSFDEKLKSRQEAREILGLPQDLFVYGTVANFYPAKNIPGYLEVCARVAEKHPDSRFVLLGDGPEYAKVEERVKELGLEDQVLIAGNRHDASELLRAFDAFVLPSTKEGMSWALLEAMAARLPCVATDVGAAGWMLLPPPLTPPRAGGEPAGWIVPASDTDALAIAMDEARDPNTAKPKAARARAAVEERFPLSKTLEGNAAALGL